MPERRTPPPLIYWDACNFLSYINKIPDRLPILDALLAEGRRGDIRIVTSTLSLVEVAFGAVEQTAQALSPEVEEQIEMLWNDRDTVLLAEFHELVARDARVLMRDSLPHGWSLKPADAIHLATAKRMKVARFHTYEGTKLKRYESMIGCSILEPTTMQLGLL